MTEWVVRRWVRFGHDRLYAETPGGTALGYLDQKTGRFHSDDAANLPILQRAISESLAGSRSDGAAPLPQPETAAQSAPTGSPAGTTDLEDSPVTAWTDISNVAPGAAARERALEEKLAQGRARSVLARLVGAKTNERAWRIGADGELAVAAQLDRLGQEWRILHAVRVGKAGADIDHVAIGPAGVFTINAKNHPRARVWVAGDTFMVNGQRVPYIRNSRGEASRAARLLTEHCGFPVTVTGVLAIVGAHNGFTIKKQPEDGSVVVVARKTISRHLRRLPARLSEREVAAIAEIARRSSTWQ